VKFIRNTVLAVILLAGFAGAAHAFTFETIAGKWCGITTNYEFSSNQLIGTFHDGDGDVVTALAQQGREAFTEFSELTTDGNKMA
jgi:hypothetical protein